MAECQTWRKKYEWQAEGGGEKRSRWLAKVEFETRRIKRTRKHHNDHDGDHEQKRNSDNKSDELKACDAYHYHHHHHHHHLIGVIWWWPGKGEHENDQRVPSLSFKCLLPKQLDFSLNGRGDHHHLMIDATPQFDTFTKASFTQQPDVEQQLQQNEACARRALYSISCNLDYLYCYCRACAIDRRRRRNDDLELDELYCYCSAAWAAITKSSTRLSIGSVGVAREKEEQNNRTTNCCAWPSTQSSNGAMINNQQARVWPSDNATGGLQIVHSCRPQAKKMHSLGRSGRPKHKFTTRKQVKPLTSSSVTWTTSVFVVFLLSLTILSTAANSTSSAKFSFWRSLVGPLYSSDASEDVSVGGQWVDQLAKQLAAWPQQTQAALFYMDQLGAKLNNLADANNTPPPCRRQVSLAELMAPSDQFTGAGNAMARRVALDQLITSNDEHDEHHDEPQQQQQKRRLAKHLTGRSYSAAAQLALDNANLVARLLAAPVNPLLSLDDEHDEQNDANFDTDGDGSQLDSSDNNFKNSSANFFNKLFGFGGQRARRQTNTETLKLALNKLVTAKFLRYLLATKLRSHTITQPEVAIHSLGLILFEDDDGDANSVVKFAGQALPGGRFVNLRAAVGQVNQVNENHDEPENLTKLRFERLPSFLAKWMLENAGNRKLNSSRNYKRPNSELQLADGHWFSPHFECSISNRWLLTYSVPVILHNNEAQVPRLRGVSFVSLDLVRTSGGSLVNQCVEGLNNHANDDKDKHYISVTSFLASTNLCHKRLRASQCVPLLPVPSNANQPLAHFRPGAYACLCPRLGSHVTATPTDNELPRALEAVDQRRAQLIKLTPTYLRDYLAATSGALSVIAQQLNYSTQFHLVGRQLEWDEALNWLAINQTNHHDDDDDDDDWPQLTCQVCARTGAPNCQAAAQPEVGNGKNSLTWARPLVLSLEVFCIVSTLTLIGVITRVRKSRLIIASGWLMLETMLIGALLLYSSVLVRYFQPTSLTCLLEPWLRELGFSIFFSSILIKLYRILTEFQTRKAHRVCLRDKDQIIYLLAVVLIVIGYMSAWTALMVDGFFVSHSNDAGTSEAPASFQPEVNFIDQNVRMATNTTKHQFDSHNSSNWRRRSAVSSSSSLSGDIDPPEVELSMTSTSTTATTRDIFNEHLEILSRGLDSFGELFLGLLESGQQYDQLRHSFVYVIRCRKLTWDYVTESSELALLLFGVHLVYKLRNANHEVHKEKLILSLAIFIELIVSTIVYLIRHCLWHSLSRDHLLLFYATRCQLSVTSTIILIFGPKLWEINKNKPGLLWGGAVRFFGSAGAAASTTDGLMPTGTNNSAGGVGVGGGGGSGGPGGQCVGGQASGNPLGGGSKRAGSQRHRCHISCEVHDHHLNDRTRLQQAMFTNSALEIGSINLADMDPDEIQAELKRVYTQLEMLKTKVMRRDNPHISKRRGGRKPGHRKFSLQAFHNRHSGSGEHSSSQGQMVLSQQQAGGNVDLLATNSTEQVSLLAKTDGAAGQRHHQVYHQTTSGIRLPALAELESENSSAIGGDRTTPGTTYLRGGGGVGCSSTSGKHVRVDDTILEYHDEHLMGDTVSNSSSSTHRNNKFGASNLTSKLLGRSNKKNNKSHKQTQKFSNSKWTPDLPSTSSLGLDDEAMMALNDSQSSGEITPQHRSSLVYGHSSSQANEPSSSIG